MSQSTSASNDIRGPAEPFDINVDDESFDKLALWREQFGDIVALTPSQRKSPAFVLNNPEHVRHVLIGNHRNYAKGVGFERVKMLLGNGIIVSDGDFWRSQRRMIQPAFHRKIIGSLARMMVECNERKRLDWQLKAENSQAINLTEEMSELALEVVLRALFSDDLDRLIESTGSNPFAMLVEDVTRDLKLAMRFRALTRHVADIMTSRREESRTELDFLSLLMETKDKETLEPMSDKALIDEVMTIIVAGHETTAGTLNWAWFLLSQHADIESALHLEVDALEAAPQFGEIPQLRYTKQFIDETLRLYPPVWLFSRKAIDQDELKQGDGVVKIPAGADIFLCPYHLHRDPRFWDNPDQCLPDRFSDEQIKERNKDVYYPFSLGSRRCIGEFFSLVDMQLHLGLLARHFTLRHIPGEPVEIEPHINLRSRHSIFMMPEVRNA
ncbi:MAG: cytochrome P450 [Granulosicoccus sp.]